MSGTESVKVKDGHDDFDDEDEEINSNAFDCAYGDKQGDGNKKSQPAAKQRLQPRLDFEESGKLKDSEGNEPIREASQHLHYRNDNASPRVAMEALRKPQNWDTSYTYDAKAGRLEISTSLNGTKIETWAITPDESKDGSWSVRPLEARDPVPDQQGLDKARESCFNAILKSGLKRDEVLEMIRDLTKLEQRARSGELGGNLPDVRAELARTYGQIDRILSGGGDGKASQELRITTARQLARELGNPTDIDQGASSDACRMVSAQARLATRSPSVVARVVADALLEGKVRYGNPQNELSLPPETRQPSSKQAVTFPRLPDERSFASQLFQLASMNALGTDQQVVNEHLAYMRSWNENINVKPYTRLTFVQTKETREDPKAAGQEQPQGPSRRDNGMKVYGVDRDGKTELVAGGARVDGGTQILLQAYSSQRVLDLFEPGKHKNCVVAHSGMTRYTREFGRDAADNRGLVLFENEDQLLEIVQKAKKEGNLPLIIASRDYSAGPGENLDNIKECLDACHNNHSMIIRDYVPEHVDDKGRKVPAHFVTDDFFGGAYDRRVLPRNEWRNYFMNAEFVHPKR